MIDSVTEWFKITQYNDKKKLRVYLDTVYQWKSHMTKDQKLLIMSS